MTGSSFERVLVMSPNWLGDAVMALPILADLRRQFPGVKVVVAARGGLASLFTLSPHVDEAVALEWTGRPLAYRAIGRDLARLRAIRADAALLLPNSFGSAWLVQRAGVAERWGYDNELRGSLLTRSVSRPALRRHQAEYYRNLARQVGIDSGPLLDLTLVIPPAALDEARAMLRSRGWDGARRLVVLAPGARYGDAKRWPTEHFARAATELVNVHRAACALVGAGADADVAQQVRSLVAESARASVFDVSGATTIETLAAVLSLARACVSNDSGTMHLAGAVGVPLAALFGPTRDRQTAPLSKPGVPARVLINHVWCRPCMLLECPLDHRCMIGLRPERIVATVAELMTGAGAPDAEPPIAGRRR